MRQQVVAFEDFDMKRASFLVTRRILASDSRRGVLRTYDVRTSWARPLDSRLRFLNAPCYLFRLSPVNILKNTIIDAARHPTLPPGKVIVFTAVSHVRCPFGVRPSRSHGSRRLRDCSPQRSR